MVFFSENTNDVRALNYIKSKYLKDNYIFWRGNFIKNNLNGGSFENLKINKNTNLKISSKTINDISGYENLIIKIDQPKCIEKNSKNICTLIEINFDQYKEY